VSPFINIYNAFKFNWSQRIRDEACDHLPWYRSRARVGFNYGKSYDCVLLDIGTYTLFKVTEQVAYSLLSNYTTSSTIKSYIDKYDFYIFPVVNPDG
jgi:hypothetical protein